MWAVSISQKYHLCTVEKIHYFGRKSEKYIAEELVKIEQFEPLSHCHNFILYLMIKTFEILKISLTPVLIYLFYELLNEFHLDYGIVPAFCIHI